MVIEVSNVRAQCEEEANKRIDELRMTLFNQHEKQKQELFDKVNKYKALAKDTQTAIAKEQLKMVFFKWKMVAAYTRVIETLQTPQDDEVDPMELFRTLVDEKYKDLNTLK